MPPTMQSSGVCRFLSKKRRMDKGCVGHAVSNGFIKPIRNNSSGLAETVEITHLG